MAQVIFRPALGAVISALVGIVSVEIAGKPCATKFAVLEPRSREKGFDEATVVGRVLEYAPVVSAVSTALAGVLTERMEKGDPVLGINTVFHRYQNRASVGFDSMSRDRVGPLHGGREINIRPC